jgi:3-methyladenine DNA glycosylase Tag
MKKFSDIYERALTRKGGEAALAALLPDGIVDAATLTAIPNDRYLSGMTSAIFKAGFVWRVVEDKWPGFEKAFFGFDISRCAYMTPEEMETIATDAGIIRNRTKVKTVQHNAQLIIEAARQHDGSFGAFIAKWPNKDYIGLLDYLKKHGSRLGGNSCQYFLRQMGKDGFILGRDGIAALIKANVIDKTPSSKTAMKQIQEAFNQWHDETGLNYASLSRILALSIDA